MGIEGIDDLKPGDDHNQLSEPTDVTTPPISTPPHEDPAPQDTQEFDVEDQAPDSDDPGDELPEELASKVHDGDIVPDNVDREDVEP